MLRFRIRYLLESKGIVSPYTFLIKNGFTPNTATRCLTGKIATLKLTLINRLCMVLNCTPNDLLEWYAGPNELVGEDHLLRNLERNDMPFGIISHINNLTLDQIKEVEQFITQINTNGNTQNGTKIV